MSTTLHRFISTDWDGVREIYRQGLATRNATFETEVPSYENWVKKFHSDLLWVACVNDNIIGWAGLQPVSERKVYSGVAEVTIYIDLNNTGKGIGKLLMNHLVKESERAGIWTLYSSIFPENKPSIDLHESTGFRKIGYREKIAQLDGVWRNTVLLERRSKTVGV
jgi:L-amino acid N-acyltransferase YncA